MISSDSPDTYVSRPRSTPVTFPAAVTFGDDIWALAASDPDPFQEIAYPNAVRAKLAISDLLGRPLARLSDEEREWINGVLAETLGRTTVMARVRERFMAPRPIVAPVGTGEEGTPC
jgi:hypothetical protein